MIEELSEAQHGYFTRAQAHDVGVSDVQLSRATDYRQIRRLDHGIYRVAGAGHDEHADLRIAWLRLDPKRRPRERTKNPTIWVSHQSAAVLLGLGTFIPPKHQFISTVRKQLRSDAACPGPPRRTDPGSVGDQRRDGSHVAPADPDRSRRGQHRWRPSWRLPP
ncbi:MAG: type IV toxin-antitoxin system AbiEi family antitoxin domain-containing protein [Acidimicrobiales bacterium]